MAPAALAAVDSSCRFSNADLGLVDCGAEECFDQLTALAADIFNVPVSLVSIVEEDEDRQFFKSLTNLPEPWASSRQTPLSHSFCQHVKRRNSELVIPNAKQNTLVKQNLAIRDLNVIAYLGVPIHGADGEPIGAFCVIDHKERHWTQYDVEVLTKLARCVSNEVLLRAALLKGKRYRSALRTEYDRVCRYTAMREAVTVAFMAPNLSVEQRFDALLRHACEAMEMEAGLIARSTGQGLETIFSHRLSDESGGGSHRPVTFQPSLLSNKVIGNQKILALADLSDLPPLAAASPIIERVGAYVGAPLVVESSLNGVIEFYRSDARPQEWTDDELSIISIVAMLASAHLQLHGKLMPSRSAEAALLGELVDIDQLSENQSSELEQSA